jgi:hypothetical protein
MARTLRVLLGIGAFALFLANPAAAQVRPEQRDRGGEWLSWSPGERSTYINGFISGYLRGSHEACLAANDVFEVGKPHRLGNDPAARCEARLDTYSKFRTGSGPDPTFYTQVITDFYTKHPEYQGVPFVYLLLFLTDRQYKTDDQLYQMALKGALRTNF